MKGNRFLRALVLIVLIVWIVPMHFMSYLERRPVRVPGIEFGNEIPEDYYGHDCPIDYLRLDGNLEVWLDGMRWARPYVPNEWDCSTQSAFLEWALECCNYEADILVDKSHAWIMVEIDGEWRHYEPVFGVIMSEGMESLFIGYWRFGDLYRLRQFFKDGWESYPHRWASTYSSEAFDEWFASEWFWWRAEKWSRLE